MLDFTLLTYGQIENKKGDGVEVAGSWCHIRPTKTDLAIILGSYGNDTYWTRTIDHNKVFVGGSDGLLPANLRSLLARPALPPSEASKISPRIVETIEQKFLDHVMMKYKIGEYGEYPQTVADKETSEKLEGLHDSKSLCPTGKSYTFDSVGLEDYDTPFKAVSYPEYEMDGKRYIRVLGHPARWAGELSTGEAAEEGKPYWVEVQPIEWLMDKSGWMVAKKGLFAGIQFYKEELCPMNFSKTFMKHYLDTYFAKEIEPVNTKEQVKTASNEQKPVSDEQKPILNEQETPAEKKAALKEKLAVTSKGKNDPAVAVAVKGTKKSHYSLTDKGDDAHVSVAGLAKKSRTSRE